MPIQSSEVNDRDDRDLGNLPHTLDPQAKSNGHQGKLRRRIHELRGTSWTLPQPEAGQPREQSVCGYSVYTVLNLVWKSDSLCRTAERTNPKDITNECRKDNDVKWPSAIYQRSRNYQVYVQRDRAC